jgi:hypothetical protein
VKVIDEKNMQIERLYRNFFFYRSLYSLTFKFCTLFSLSLEGCFQNQHQQSPQQCEQDEGEKKIEQFFMTIFTLSSFDDDDDDDDDTLTLFSVYINVFRTEIEFLYEHE